MSLREILPQPLRVTLAGQPYRATPLTLGDLAALESWAAGRAGSPLGAALPAIAAAPAGPGRDRLVRACWLAVEEATGRATYGAPGFLEQFLQGEGRVLLAWACLRSQHPDLDLDDVAPAALASTDAEFDDLLRLAIGLEPLDELSRFVDEPAPRPPGDGPTWAAIFVELAGRYAWITPDSFARLTLPQLVALRSGGAARPGACRHAAGSAGFWASAARRAALFATPQAPERKGEDQ